MASRGKANIMSMIRTGIIRRRMIKIILIIFALSATACSEKIDPYEAYANGNYEAAKQQLIPLVEKGDLKAITHLAAIHQIDQKYDEAIKLYTIAAKKNYAPAQYNLGVMMHQGIGIKRNVSEAYGWLNLATEQGHSKAQEFIKGLLRFEITPNQTMQAKAWAKKQLKDSNE